MILFIFVFNRLSEGQKYHCNRAYSQESTHNIIHSISKSIMGCCLIVAKNFLNSVSVQIYLMCSFKLNALGFPHRLILPNVAVPAVGE